MALLSRISAAPGTPAATGWRGMNQYTSRVDELQVAVREACDTEAEWPARVAAGIYAALDFAIANPELAHSLMMDARNADPSAPFDSMVDLFSEVLASEVPRRRRVAGSTDQALVGAVAIFVGDHLRSGNLERLREMAPELVHLILLPYLGFDEAKRWAASTAR